jgi:hypothetical protein
MSQCPDCGAPLVGPKGEPLLACARCAARNSHKALLALQANYLPKVMASNEPPFRLLRQAGRQDWHVELMGYRGQAWCGVLFDQGNWHAREAKYSFLDGEFNLCDKCRAALAEKAAAVAMEAR